MRRKADGSLPTITKRRMLVWFAALLVVQGLHSVEHVMQLVQRYVLHEPSPQGLLGRWTNLEWMHLAYNVALGALLVAMFVRFRMWRRAWRSPLLGWIALVAATAFQLGLHVPEHAVRIYEFLRYGWNPAPGILGHTPLHGTGPFDLLLLHFWYNAIVTTLLAVSFFSYRGVFWRESGPAVLPLPRAAMWAR